MKLLNFVTGILFFTLFSTAAISAEKDWTFFVWMNGDNNLCSFAGKDMTEIKSLDVSEKVNFIVAFDCSQKNDSKLVEIRGDKEIVLETSKEYDMGDAKALAKMAKFVFEKYPAKHRFLDIWNHGSGWKNTMLRNYITGISYDDQSGNYITTPQLGEAVGEISQVFHLDVVGYDACLMQMVEIAYEIGPQNADYIVGSEAVEPGDGWDYRTIVKALKAGADPLTLSKAVVDGFIGVSDGDDTLSILDMKKLYPFVTEFAAFINDYPKASVYAAMKKAHRFDDVSYKDLGSFMSFLPAKDTKELKAAYSELVVYYRGRAAATGLSIYFDERPVSTYHDLKFAKDTGWLK